MDRLTDDFRPIPSYELYGEAQAWPTPDLIHVESISARSRLHNWEIKPHRHTGLFQLLWLREGHARCLLDDEQVRLAAGSVVLVPRHSVHGFQFSGGAEGLVMTLAYPLLTRAGGELARQVMAMNAPQVCEPPALLQDDGIAALLPSLAIEFDARREHRGLILESLAVAALASLLRLSAQGAGSVTAGRASEHLTRFLAEIEQRFREHLPLAHYAAHVGISAAHLNALCRAQTGRSALEMIHARLALEARRELVYTAMTIREVSDALGFGDPAYFTRFFRRATGVSPREFRQRTDGPSAPV
jgi:AraC family transcriptional activator of pobA